MDGNHWYWQYNSVGKQLCNLWASRREIFRPSGANIINVVLNNSQCFYNNFRFHCLILHHVRFVLFPYPRESASSIYDIARLGRINFNNYCSDKQLMEIIKCIILRILLCNIFFNYSYNLYLSLS